MGGIALSKEKALDWIEENDSRLIEISDQIWNYAEVGLQEFKSAALLADELEKEGFAVERGVAGMPTAFVATWGSGKPVIGIMGEYDALPGLSQKVTPSREPLEEGEPGHGCGHNIIGTSGLGAAIAVKAALEASTMDGTVKYFGCPAEETLIGKIFMVRDGLFDGLDAALENHPSSIHGVLDGNFLAMNSVKFTFHGVAAHAAGNPDQGKSALDAVELMNTGANFLREHVNQEARIHYVITNGGGEPNVVPPRAESWYYIRAPRRDQVDQIYQRILNIAKGADLMAETTHDVHFQTGCFECLPNLALNGVIEQNMKAIGPPEYSSEEHAFAEQLSKSISPEMKKGVLMNLKVANWQDKMDVILDRDIIRLPADVVFHGSTDVGDVSWVAPTSHFFTSSAVLGTPGHSWQVVVTSGMSIGHKSLIYGAKVMAATAMDLITDAETLNEVKEEFTNGTRGTTYESPLPPDLKPPLDQLPKH
jgi:aminobenzoyl-glutamate utilization protein B